MFTTLEHSDCFSHPTSPHPTSPHPTSPHPEYPVSLPDMNGVSHSADGTQIRKLLEPKEFDKVLEEWCGYAPEEVRGKYIEAANKMYIFFCMWHQYKGLVSPNAKSLDLSNLLLKNLPKHIDDLPVVTLDLRNNCFTQFPDVLLNLPCETRILLEGNPFPGEEIIRIGNECQQRRQNNQPFPTLWFSDLNCIAFNEGFQVGLEKESEKKDDFNTILFASSLFTLFPALRGMSIPDKLTPEQVLRVRSLFQKYDPNLLLLNPVLDVQGNSVDLNVDLNSVIDCFYGGSYSLSKAQEIQISKIFYDYPNHLEFLRSQVEIRTIVRGEVPKHEEVLVGQEGVFAKQTISKDVFLCMFDGVLFQNPEDINKDKMLRKLAGCDKYYNRQVSKTGIVLEGFGISMKFNAAFLPEFFFPDEKRINLTPYFIDATHRVSNQQLRCTLFKTNRCINPGEQLYFNYDCNASRE